jgi:hypothetical protein
MLTSLFELKYRFQGKVPVKNGKNPSTQIVIISRGDHTLQTKAIFGINRLF